MNKKRYQHCNMIVKAYRWIRYKPYYAFLAIKAYIFKSKTSSFSFTWSIYMGMADFDMKHYYTYGEVFSKIKKRIDSIKD